MSITIDDKIIFSDASEIDTNFEGFHQPVLPPQFLPTDAANLPIRAQRASYPVGMFITGRSTISTGINHGDLIDGSTIYPSEIGGTGEDDNYARPMYGTWRAHGYVQSSTTVTIIYQKVSD